MADEAKSVEARPAPARDEQRLGARLRKYLLAGLVVLDMRGLLSGYIQILCVRPDRRASGLGSALLRWAEDRIFRDSPNAFICVSSFNAGARRLYERLGFEPVGVLRELIVPGHDELLLRKTRGPWSEFSRTR